MYKEYPGSAIVGLRPLFSHPEPKKTQGEGSFVAGQPPVQDTFSSGLTKPTPKSWECWQINKPLSNKT